MPVPAKGKLVRPRSKTSVTSGYDVGSERLLTGCQLEWTLVSGLTPLQVIRELSHIKPRGASPAVMRWYSASSSLPARH